MPWDSFLRKHLYISQSSAPKQIQILKSKFSKPLVPNNEKESFMALKLQESSWEIGYNIFQHVSFSPAHSVYPCNKRHAAK